MASTSGAGSDLSALPGADDNEEVPFGKEAKVSSVPDAPLTAAQEKLLEAFAAAVGPAVFPLFPEPDRPYWTGSGALLRILVARSWDLPAATAMYKQIAEFRRERECHRLLSDPRFYSEPEVLRRYFPWGFVGVDKDGYPILVERTGHIDLIGMNASVGTEDFLTWVCWYHEVQERMMSRASSALGKNRHKMTVIVDLAGIGLRTVSASTLSVLHKRTRLEEDHYPEVVHRLFLINTPSLFSTVWNVVKRFVDPGTANKMQILSSDYMPTLLKYIDEDNIPAYLGGKLTDDTGDKECRRFISAGGLVPLAFTAGVANDGNGAGEEVVVPAGKASDVVVHVPAGATVSWRFGVAEKDISFSVSAYRAAGAPAAAAAGGSASPSPSPSPSSSPAQAAAKAASIAPIPVARSTYGVHVNSPAFLSAGAAAQSNPFPVPAASVASSDDVPAGAAAGAAEETAVAATRTASVSVQSGSWTAPAAQPMLVRLRWDNSYSWMASKTVARRVDVSVAADGGGEGAAAAAAVRAPDADGDLATARADHRERITEWVAAGIKGPGGKK